MESMEFFIALGFLLCGFIIGYPLGHIVSKREAAQSFACDLHKTYEPCRPIRRRKVNHVEDILSAEILEEK
jgi:hypothetical protein